MKLKLLRDFQKNEDGGILAFYLIMFITLMIGGGMAVDFMNSEYQREKVQDALDRGVLAATAIGNAAHAVSPAEIAAAETQSLNIAKSYLAKAGFDPEAPGVNITPDFTLNSQQVAATSNFEVDTFFLRLAGIDTLGGSAAAGAIVTQNDIEISLVLDVSGSMWGAKIEDLRVAGSDFVGNMLAGDRSDYTFINLIPFDHSVNMPVNIYRMFDNNMWHNYHGCGIFTNASYANTTIDPNTDLLQVTHILWSTYDVLAALASYDFTNFPVGYDDYLIRQVDYQCDVPPATLYSNNTAALQASIGSLQPRGATSGFMGVKWATALLDPTSGGPVVTSMIENGEVPASFAGKPAAYNDDNTLKFIVFMSDGQMNNHSSTYEESSYGRVADADGNLLPGYSQENADYWDTAIGTVEHPGHGFDGALPTETHGPTPIPVASAALQTACTTAKDAGIMVFSIAYGLTPGSAADTALSDCATSAGFYYNVDTADLDTAFASIEASIQALRLTN